MRLLELREGNNQALKLTYIRVNNPANPKQFIYVERGVYAQIIDAINQGGLSSFLEDLWNGVKTVVGGTISTVVGGVISGVTGRPMGGPVATSPQANGQPQITVNATPGGQYPAAILPGVSNNTLLLFAGGTLAVILAMKALK